MGVSAFLVLVLSGIRRHVSGGSRILKRGGSSVHVTERIKHAKRALGGVARGHMREDGILH